MGIFSFFKKITKNNEAEEPEIKKLPFSEIRSWIESRRNENQIKEKEVLILIKDKIEAFVTEINEKIQSLSEFDIGSKKAEEKFKIIVAESRKKYIEFVEEFIKNLRNIKRDNLEEYIYNTKKLFIDYTKRLHISYEKTTILIGKEIADVKNSLKYFSKDLIKLFEENKGIIEYSKTLLNLESVLNKISLAEENIKKISEEINLLNKKIIDREDENKRLEEEIEVIKKSEDYLEYLKNQEKISFLEQDLKKDFLSLKQLFDFKTLATFFHADNEKMELLNFHKENFQASFQKDDGRIILSMLNDSGLDNKKISEKIEDIGSKSEDLAKMKQEIGKDATKEFSIKITRTNLEINDLEIEKAREEKRYEKLKANKESLIDLLKQEIKKEEIELV